MTIQFNITAAEFSPTSILAAEFTNGSARRAPVLDINRIDNGHRTFIECIPVLDKREARKIAKAIGATPWNF